MLDSDLAQIYGYTIKAFNQQVQRNIEKFDEDFMFRLNEQEFENLRSQSVTSSWGGRRYNPYVFTEQGIYMLMTVLKGVLAIKQSKALIRIFKEMKDFILEKNTSFVEYREFVKLSMQANENTMEIKNIKENMTTKEELVNVIKSLTDIKVDKEQLILNGQQVESILAYTNIYSQVKHTIYIIDNYINLKTLVLLKDIDKNVKVTIFTDNINNGLHKIEYDDFINEYPIQIDFKKTNGIYHDRYIVIDYGYDTESIFHCGASSKDSGKKVTTIIKSDNNKMYYNMINDLLKNNKLVLI